MKIAISAATFTAAAVGFAATAAAQTQPAAPAPQQPAATSPARAPGAPAMQHAPGMSHQDMMQGKAAPASAGMACGCPCCKGMMQQGAAKTS